MGDFAERLSQATGGTPELAAAAKKLEEEASAAFFDDLNAPLALGALFTFVRTANAELSRNGSDADALEAARSAFAKINGVLDIIPDPEVVDDAAEIEGLLSERKEAREKRDFARADAIRRDLEEKGIEIKDGPTGTSWKRIR